MTRHDLYGQVHKGLRARLVAGATQVASTDFTRLDEARRCAAALRRLLAFLDEHAEHEDADIVPDLARLNPELAASLQADHQRLHALQADLAGLLDRLDGANAVGREALGARVHELVWKLVAAHVTHMAVEEDAGNRTLWAHHTDDELGAIEGKIIASIAPERLADWFELMLPAVHLGERAATLRTLSSVMPTEVFDELTASARTTLGPAAWSAACEVAGISSTTARKPQLAS